MNYDATFEDLVLDSEGLHTPEGIMALGDLTRAEFVRDIVREEHASSSTEMSAEAVVGGALVGGALLGTAGAIGGALLGSTVTDDVPGHRAVESNTVRLVFETDSASYLMDVPREKEMDAYNFAGKVQRAMKHRR
jgi:hypothetical protein